MASSKAYLEFVLEQLSALEGVSVRPMMGEYILYYQGKVVGGVYDDRLLLKPVRTAPREQDGAAMDIPYPGAKPMLVADIDDAEACCSMIRAIAAALPAGKKRGRGTEENR